jgi:sulfatase modifying factor 1
MMVAVDEGMVWIAGGEFTMGSDVHYREEAPAHRVALDGFWIDRMPVTNDEFAGFVNESGYVTVAERPLRPEDYPGVAPEALVSGSAVFRQPPGPVDLDEVSWWEYVAGASWRAPEGPASSLDRRGDHPVVQVAYEDALAYADWAGRELPTEAQWEFAARGGLDGYVYSWGDADAPVWELANLWVGEFPWQSPKADPPGATPVGSYPPNGYGLFDMTGNTWEWTRDYYHPRHALPVDKPPCCLPRNPTGAPMLLADPAAPSIALRVLKGGSFLCADNYCLRYRPAARIPQASDSATVHIGFRCVATTPGGPSRS